ncbi:MAG TPA: protein-glutamate O-methyltransferase CheR [Candidatus Eisenbacteria bacterium]|jgi:chemotaxis protein methyltransferase CheR
MRAERASLSVNDFTYVRQLLLERAGILLESGKEYLADARLSALSLTEGYGSIGELLDRAQSERDFGPLQRKVIEAMTITETSFFRDLHPFEALRRHIFPQVLAARASERTLNIWCAAAASGQEPYSVAMVLREHFPQLAGWKVLLLASDISESMLARARAGAFSQIEINRGLPAAHLVKYFRKQENEWFLSEDVKRMVEFRRINLTGPWPMMPPLDIVLMRNVLLYFDVDTKRTILERVSRVMRPEAVLFLGSGETTLNLVERFVPVPFGKAIGYQLASTDTRRP